MVDTMRGSLGSRERIMLMVMSNEPTNRQTHHDTPASGICSNSPHLHTRYHYASREMYVQLLNSSFIGRVKTVNVTGLHDAGH